MMTKLTPPDLGQCQTVMIRPRPFRMGGDCIDRERCANVPVVIATEKRPNKEDGIMGSMSLCTNCQKVMIEQLGNDFATFEQIKR